MGGLDDLRTFVFLEFENYPENTRPARMSFIEAIREHARGLPKTDKHTDMLAQRIARHVWDSKQWPKPTT